MELRTSISDRFDFSRLGDSQPGATARPVEEAEALADLLDDLASEFAARRGAPTAA